MSLIKSYKDLNISLNKLAFQTSKIVAFFASVLTCCSIAYVLVCVCAALRSVGNTFLRSLCFHTHIRKQSARNWYRGTCSWPSKLWIAAQNWNCHAALLPCVGVCVRVCIMFVALAGGSKCLVSFACSSCRWHSHRRKMS